MRAFSIQPPTWGSLLLVLLFLIPLGACSAEPSGESSDGPSMELMFDPAPPRVGPARLTVVISNADDAPLEGASVEIEGNMNHAGMKPVFGSAVESSPGHYETDFEFTMGGDWFVVASVTTSDGRKHSLKRDVRGVRAE